MDFLTVITVDAAETAAAAFAASVMLYNCKYNYYDNFQFRFRR